MKLCNAVNILKIRNKMQNDLTHKHNELLKLKIAVIICQIKSAKIQNHHKNKVVAPQHIQDREQCMLTHTHRKVKG